MRYFMDGTNEVYGYNNQQLDLIARAVSFGWNEVTGNWPPPKPLAEVKAEKLASLQQARDKAAAANVTVQGKTFSAESNIADLFAKLADRASRSKPSRLAAIYQVDGSPVAPNHALLDAIEDAVADQIEAAWNKYGALVQQVNAATTVEHVNVIAW